MLKNILLFDIILLSKYGVLIMKNYFKNCLDKFGIEITEKQLEQFMKYQELLIDWNTKINLTAITEPEEIIKKHFCDSLSSLSFIKKGAKLADIGTGAGFPGIPLAIMRPDVDVLLIDSLNKRIKFLDTVISELGLENVNTIHLRAEEGGRNKLRDSFDIATARAVASLNVLCEYCLPYVKPGGMFLSYKGENVAQELLDAKNAIGKLSAREDGIFIYEIPDSDIKHSIVKIAKNGKTPKEYPRISAKISKAPL